MLEQYKGNAPQQEARLVFSQNSLCNCCCWRRDAVLDGPLVQSSQALLTFLKQSEFQKRKWTHPGRWIYSVESDLCMKLDTISKAHKTSWEPLKLKGNQSPFSAPLFVYFWLHSSLIQEQGERPPKIPLWSGTYGSSRNGGFKLPWAVALLCSQKRAQHFCPVLTETHVVQ